MTQRFQARGCSLSPHLAWLVLALFASPAWAEEAIGPTSFEWQSGEQVYAKVCAHCHESTIAPVIQGRGLPAAYYVAIARNGFRAMPAFREAEINDASLQAVAEFLANSEPPEGADLQAGGVPTSEVGE